MQELDEITLARARRGDRDAFRQLVVAYQRPVHAVIGRMLVGVGSFAEVEELAQETFVRVFRALPEFESQGPGRLSKWVLTIAARLALDELEAELARSLGAARARELRRERRGWPGGEFHWIGCP